MGEVPPTVRRGLCSNDELRLRPECQLTSTFRLPRNRVKPFVFVPPLSITCLPAVQLQNLRLTALAAAL